MEAAINKIAIFKGKKIRKVIYKGEWWFVILDVIAALTDSPNPSGYLRDMRRRDVELTKGGAICPPPFWLKLQEANKR